MKIIIFDIFAPYAHFKVPYTITSPLTFPVPSKTAVYGIISAIVGLDKKNYLEEFQDNNCTIAIKINNPIKKIHISENLINTKNVDMFARMNSSKKAPRSQIKIEFLKEPSFRIYISLNDNKLFNEFHTLLREHKSIYTVSMGLSECIANYKYINCIEAEKIKNKDKFINITSILPLDKIDNVEKINFLEPDKKFIKVHLPLEMKQDRELIKSGDFLIEAKGNDISAVVSDYYRLDSLNENIILF